MFAKNITVFGNKVSIPVRLIQMFDSINSNSKRVAPVPEEALSFLHNLEAEDEGEVNFGELLKIIERDFDTGNVQKGVVVLGCLAGGCALIERENGRLQEGIAILADTLLFEQSIIPFCQPEVAKALADQSVYLIEQILKFFSLIGSLDTIVVLQKDIATALGMIETAWTPEFRKTIFALRDLISLLSYAFQEDKNVQLNILRTALQAIADIKNSLRNIDAAGSRRQKKILEAVLNSLDEIGQQEFMLVANTQYVSEGLNQEQITRQTRKLIGQVEQRLRVLIISRYAVRYGENWLSQVKAIFPKMYDRWVSNYNREKSAFKNYNDHAPDILEFAGFDDLLELISSQWRLFHDFLDFGYEPRNEAIFYDKMKQITKVRNPLAHNRIIPENEILRARVLCTDILLALDSSSVSSK